MVTSDGDEYLTPQQLIRKIKQELYIRGGRVKTVDLAKELNLNINQIDQSVPEIKEVQIVARSLITNCYLEEIAQEINVKLQIQGKISVDDLTLQFDLPVDVLQNGVLKKYLGTIITGRQDSSEPKVFYTEEYVTRTKAKIRGALMGLLKPTSVHRIITHFNLTEGFFVYLFDQLNDTGAIMGRHNLFRALYEPSCYTKSQNNWLIASYKVNNYLEYVTLILFDIPDEQEYVKKILPNENMVFLKGCVLAVQRKEQLETALQECIVSKSYLNVQSFLNFDLYDEDIETFLIPLLKKYNTSTILFNETVFSIQFIETLEQVCLPVVQKNAESVVMSGKYQQYLETQIVKSNGQYTSVGHKPERCEESIFVHEGGKRNCMKTTAGKKHSRSKHIVQDSDSDKTENVIKNTSCLEIINTVDVENTIKESLENEGLDDFVTPIAEHIKGHLNLTALAIAKDFSEKLFQDASQNRKLTHSSAQDRINVLINDIKLYEKGSKLFPSDQQPQFIKYLLKSIGGDVLSEFCKYAANQCNLSVQGDVLTVEQRNKIINDLSEEYMKPLRALNSVFAECNMEQFYEAIDVCLSEFGMTYKNINKKKNRLLVHNHREKLMSNIKNFEEPALVLHLVVLVLFTVLTQNMLHASGRQVPLIILYLKSQLKEEDFDKLQKYHEIVAKYLTAADEEKESIDEKLKEDLPSLKSIVTDIKKYKL